MATEKSAVSQTEVINIAQEEINMRIYEIKDQEGLNDEIRKRIEEMCKKLEQKLGKTKRRDSGFGQESPINYLEELIQSFIKNHSKLEDEINTCLQLLDKNYGNKLSLRKEERPPAVNGKLKTEIQKLVKENKDMVDDNYKILTEKQKLDKEVSNKLEELKVKEVEINTLKSKLRELEAENMQFLINEEKHIEIEKNLKEKINDLRQKEAENEEIKIKMQEEIEIQKSHRQRQQPPRNVRNPFPRQKPQIRRKKNVKTNC